MLREVDVLWVVQVCVRRVEDGVNHPRLQIQENCAGDVVLIISLWSFTNNQGLAGDTAQSVGCCVLAGSGLPQFTLQALHLVAHNGVALQLHTSITQ